jgi:hypothetical protein
MKVTYTIIIEAAPELTGTIEKPIKDFDSYLYMNALSHIKKIEFFNEVKI